jgi:hypothetical protein
MARYEPGLADGGQAASSRIDVHAHYVPADLQASLPSAHIFRGFATWQPQAPLEMMDRQGIATAILSMVLWNGIFAAAGDAAAARRVARSSNEGPPKPFAATPPGSADLGAFRCPMSMLPWPRSTTRSGRCD